MLFSPLKDLQDGLKRKLQNHWSTHFYEHVFTQIDETKFERLYHDGYSRPNKPVNELVSLEIIKHLLGMSDEELEHAYVFDFRVRNALGKETLGDNICQKTFTNFRGRLLEHEEETGENLLHEIFEDHRDYLQEEFEIDASTQRMDSTLIEANIKELSRMDLLGRVVYNFLTDLPEDRLEELPADMDEFADRENSELSYELAPEEAPAAMETLAEWAGWLVDQFESHPDYTELESFDHLQRALTEQCYRLAELEEDEKDTANTDSKNDDDTDSAGWEPHRTLSSVTEDDAHEDETESPDSDEHEQQQDSPIALRNPGGIPSGSLHSSHDDEATFRRKRGEGHIGYVTNLAETVDPDEETENPFRLITAVRTDTNNTNDEELLDEDIEDLRYGTGLTDLLVDGGYTHQEVESRCADHGITQHFTGLTGENPAEEKVSFADAEWDGHRMVACPAGHEPFEQRYMPESGRISGRMATEFCEGCPYKEDCFVEEKKQFYSYGFYERRLEVAQRRKRLNDPEEQDFLNIRAGAESMINEVHHKDGEKTRFTGIITVKNASIAKAIGTNLKRASRFIESEAHTEESVG